MVNPKLRTYTVVGSGLIGTSIGLALRAHGHQVSMIDIDPEAQALARDLIGGEVPLGQSDLWIIASPLSTISSVVADINRQSLDSRFMDISSVKTNPLLDVEALGIDLARFLPTHPMAGREVGGAESARADLFQSRPWIVDSSRADPDLFERGREVVEACGGHLIEMSSHTHDQAVALVSHLPQILSSVLAGELEDAPQAWLELAGSGLRDTVRIAGSSPTLWREIIVANRAAIAPLLASVINQLQALMAGLDDPLKVQDVIERGNRGRSNIPGKHGGVPRNYTYIPVVIEDKPGQLAALFDECAIAEVNIEDLAIEHSPEQFTGLITLALSRSDAEKLYTHLSSKGWNAHTPR